MPRLPSSPLWRREVSGGLPTDPELEVALEPINRWIEARDQGPDWERIAQVLNDYLGSGVASTAVG